MPALDTILTVIIVLIIGFLLGFITYGAYLKLKYNK